MEGYDYGCHSSGQQKATVHKQGLPASWWKKVPQEPQRCHVAMVFSRLMEEKWLVLFSRNAFSQAAQGAGFACKKSFHLPEETGRHPATYCRTRAGELLGRDGFQTADIISSVHHCIAVDVWEATAFGTHLPRHWCWVTRNGMWAVSEGRKRRCQKSTKNTSPI